MSSLVTLPARDAERLLVGHFTDRIAASGKGARPLQIMHAMRMIQNLPTGITPGSRKDIAAAANRAATLSVKADGESEKAVDESIPTVQGYPFPLTEGHERHCTISN